MIKKKNITSGINLKKKKKERKISQENGSKNVWNSLEKTIAEVKKKKKLTVQSAEKSSARTKMFKGLLGWVESFSALNLS